MLSRKIWLNRDFALLWAGESISQVGSQVTMLGLPLLAILTLDASPGALGILSAVQLVPLIVISPAAGIWVDRNSRRLALVGSNFARAAVMAVVPVLAFTDVLAMWHLYVVAFVAGCFTAVFDVAYQSFIPVTVTRADLHTANARMGVSYSTAQAAGPGTAGLLVQFASAPGAIILDAVSYLFGAFSILAINAPDPPRAPVTSSWRLDFITGMRTAFQQRVLRYVAMMSAWFNLFEQAILTLFPVYAVRTLDLSPGTVGVVLSAGGVGAIIGAFLVQPIAARFGVGRVTTGSQLLSSGSFALVALASGPTPVVVAMLLLGFGAYGAGLSLYNVQAITSRQTLVPDELLGRTNASYRTISSSTLPVGAILGGWLGTAAGLRPALVFLVVALTAGSIAFSLTPISRIRSWDDRREPIAQPLDEPA